MELLGRIREHYPELTEERPESHYVYICYNGDWLLAVGQTTGNRPDALDGTPTTQKHTKAGICMMASAIKECPNRFAFIPSGD